MEKSFPSISIMSMAGCGKTEIGKRLASIFDFDFFDTDQIIEEHFNKKFAVNFGRSWLFRIKAD